MNDATDGALREGTQEPAVRNVRQIAALAGVSTATVSRVYRGVGRVSPQMRERVQQVIERYDYRPSHLGEALARRRHDAIGIVFPGLGGPYFAELIRGLEGYASAEGLSVHVLDSRMARDPKRELTRTIRRVDGVLLHADVLDPAAVAHVRRLVPCVLVGADPGLASPPPAVRTDERPFRDLVEHLLRDHGLRRLLFVGTPTGSPDVTTRWEHFVAAHRARGLADPAPPLPTGFAQSDGADAAAAVVAGGWDGAVCANDELAHGLLLGALGRGIAVPGRLVITGVDDVPLSARTRPGLTTVRRPIADLAIEGARILRRYIDGESVPDETVLPSAAVLRGSCGCPEKELP